MIEHDSIAEKEILEAARKVFISKGYKGATMRDIAALAGVNPAMVNYYFRSKERLFSMIFDEAFKTLFAKMGEQVFTRGSLFEKIERITTAYVETLTENPSLPTFVLSELAHNQRNIVEAISSRQEITKVLEVLDGDIEQALSEGIIRPIKSMELCLNIISLTVFPFASRPILDKIAILTRTSNQEIFDNLSQSITKFVINAIRIK